MLTNSFIKFKFISPKFFSNTSKQDVYQCRNVLTHLISEIRPINSFIKPVIFSIFVLRFSLFGWTVNADKT